MKDSRIFRRYAAAWAYLGGFVAVQAAYASLSPRAQASFVAWASTSVVNLSHDPVGCLVVSAFVTGGGAWELVVWVPVIALAMFGANRGVGNWRLVAVCAAGHVAGTLVSEGIVAWRVSAGALPASYRHLIDVGPSYVVVSAVVAALLCAPRVWRVLAAVDLLFLVFVARIFAGLTELDVAAVGHLTAITTAAAATPFLRSAPWPVTRWRPGRLRRARSGT
jgi:hypothetical protein